MIRSEPKSKLKIRDMWTIAEFTHKNLMKQFSKNRTELYLGDYHNQLRKHFKTWE